MVIITYSRNQVFDMTQRFLILLELLLRNGCFQVFGITSLLGDRWEILRMAYVTRNAGAKLAI